MKIEGHLVSLSLNGDFNFFKDESIEGEVIAKPDHVAHGHRKPIIGVHSEGGRIITVDTSGRFIAYQSNESGLPTVTNIVSTDKPLCFVHFTTDEAYFATTVGKDIFIYDTATFSLVNTIKTEGFVH